MTLIERVNKALNNFIETGNTKQLCRDMVEIADKPVRYQWQRSLINQAINDFDGEV